MWREPIGECIGAGGFASVWELGAGRVLKVAHAGHDLARARIAREAEALATIGAPAVPRIHGSGVLDDGRAWIAMERVSGHTLAKLTTKGPLPYAEAIVLGVAALSALERVHAAGFVHRDIKPDNLVAGAGGVAIIDLGLARKLPDDPDDPTRANVQVGSLEYIAPEQIGDAAAVDARSDLYALGCVLYELIAGRPPFVGDAAALERAHSALRAPRLGALAQVPAALETVVHDCLAKDPARRPASAVELRRRLIAAGEQPSAMSGMHAHSVIREGKQPVVLVWAELPRVDRALLGSLTGRRLAIASQRGRRVLAGVLGAEHADPAATAIAAARDLAAAGARVALHLEAVRIETTAGTASLHGDAIERPEGWLPAAPWTGVIVTRAFAAVAQAPTRTSEAGAEFRALADERKAGELIGRDVLLTDLAADAAAALRGTPRSEHSGSGAWRAAGPAFALLFGDAGVGKTALARELARRIGELGPRVHVGTIPAPGTGRPGHAALADLIGQPTGPIVRAVGDALRAAAREHPTAVILDDLHLADHELLDALEYATLGGEPLPLWILGIAAPRLDARRPHLGSRAERRRRDALPPLDEDDAVALTATLLYPAEYPPLRALRRLAQLAHGNPLHLVMLAREIHERGAVKPRPGGGHYLDTGALDDLQPVALGPWLAARELAHLSVELVALARVCAVLGGDVHRDEVVAVVEAVERAGGATTPIDVDVGLRELAAAGILVATDHGWTFRQTLLEEGIYATTHEDERRALHAAALEHWRGAGLDDARIATRVAFHAEAVDARPTAAAAFARLGERAAADHRTLDADQAWSGAVRNLAGDELVRARALLGRARARYRLQRMREAFVDLEEAARIAHAGGELALEVEALIEQGIVLDFREDFEGSKAAVATARARLGPTRDRGLELDLDLGDARAAFREQRYADAAPALRAVLAEATALDRFETETIAALLLGPVLSQLGELDEAERVFDHMLDRCHAHGDRFHLAAAYGNRAWISSARGDIDRSHEDLRLVIQLARESGQAHFERVATYNLGEDRLWEGALDEALQLAKRSFALQSRAAEGTTQPDRMLLARVHAARGEASELAQVLATFAGEAVGDDDRVYLDVLASAPADILAATEALGVPQRLELGHLVRARATTAERAALRALAETHPIWVRRCNEF